jgi:multisubunit Na+/H+ antiporter MnhB subunit
VKNSLFLQTALKFLVPLLLAMSVVVMWRGHQLPGGGFIGGLIASSALVLRELASSHFKGLRFKNLNLSSVSFIVLGLTLAAGSSFIAPLSGKLFMQSIWFTLPLVGEIGTPVIFDMGVYFTVIGVVTSILLPLLREEKLDERSAGQ